MEAGSVDLNEAALPGTSSSSASIGTPGRQPAQVVVVGGVEDVMVWWTMDTAALASGRTRFDSDAHLHLVLRVYIESKGGRRSTHDHRIERWNGHLEMSLPKSARRVVAAIGFLGEEGFSHIARSAPIQRPRKMQSEAPLRTSQNRYSDGGVSHGDVEVRFPNEFAARLNRPFSGRSNQGLKPELSEDFVSAKKHPSTTWKAAETGTFSLCITHEIGSATDPCEYVIDTCLPVIQLCRTLAMDGCTFPIVLSLNALLLTYLNSDEMVEDVRRVLQQRLAELRPGGAITDDPKSASRLVQHERDRVHELSRLFDAISGDLISEYRRLSESTDLEFATRPLSSSALTDLMGVEDAVRIQIQGAACVFRRIMKMQPQGLILTDAGYMPSFSRGIADAKYQYTVVDEAGFRGATAPLQDGVYAPIHGAVTGLAAFVSHHDMHRWSGVTDVNPLAFYRERSPGHLPSWTGARWSGARLTDAGMIKARYEIDAARSAATEHAAGWWFFQRDRLHRAAKHMDQRPHGTLVLSALELTQEWAEGLLFVAEIARLSHAHTGLKMVGLSARLRAQPRHQVAWPGPVVNPTSARSILPYALPRIAGAGRTISELLNQDFTQTESAYRQGVVAALNAFVLSHAALDADDRSSMERIRQYSDVFRRAVDQGSPRFEGVVADKIAPFVEDDLTDLALM